MKAPPPSREDEIKRTIEEYKKVRAEKKPPTRDELAEESIEKACGRAVEAMRYGMHYDEVLARVMRAIDEELCREIHES